MCCSIYCFFSFPKIWYIEVQISRSVSESPLEFEITRVDGSLYSLVLCDYWAYFWILMRGPLMRLKWSKLAKFRPRKITCFVSMFIPAGTQCWKNVHSTLIQCQDDESTLHRHCFKRCVPAGHCSQESFILEFLLSLHYETKKLTCRESKIQLISSCMSKSRILILTLR